MLILRKLRLLPSHSILITSRPCEPPPGEKYTTLQLRCFFNALFRRLSFRLSSLPSAYLDISRLGLSQQPGRCALYLRARSALHGFTFLFEDKSTIRSATWRSTQVTQVSSTGSRSLTSDGADDRSRHADLESPRRPGVSGFFRELATEMPRRRVALLSRHIR